MWQNTLTWETALPSKGGKCFKKGHYESMCKTTNLAQIETQSNEEQFLGTLEQSPVTLTGNPWEVTLILNGLPVLFKIDTGQT